MTENTSSINTENPGTFKVRGYKPIFGDTTMYVIANSIAEVEQHFSTLSPEDGGFVRWSTEPVDGLPEDAKQACPECSFSYSDPRHVIDLT